MLTPPLPLPPAGPPFSSSASSRQVPNVEDDLARELAFYNQALAAAQAAIGRFESAGVPWLRPPDYYAEMVKSDEHMAKVKEQLMFEQRQIELAEERRKQREQKMYGKQVQAERTREKSADKKGQIDQISKLRKQRVKSVSRGAEAAAADATLALIGGRVQEQHVCYVRQDDRQGGCVQESVYLIIFWA